MNDGIPTDRENERTTRNKKKKQGDAPVSKFPRFGEERSRGHP